MTQSLPISESTKSICSLLENIVIAADGPLGVQEISRIGGVSTEELQRLAGNQDVYTWLLHAIATTKYKEMREDMAALRSMNDFLTHLLSDSGTRKFLSLFTLAHKIKEQSVGYDGDFRDASKQLTSFQATLGFMERIKDKEEGLEIWVRFLAVVGMLPWLDMYKGMTKDPRLPFEWEDLHAYLSGGSLS